MPKGAVDHRLMERIRPDWPFMGPRDLVLNVEPREPKRLEKRPDAREMLCRLAGVDQWGDIGMNGPVVASGTLPGGDEDSKYSRIFNRDSLEVANATREICPQLLVPTLHYANGLLGMRYDPSRSCKYGKGYHEIPPPDVMKRFGWKPPYHGQVDGDVQWVRLMAWACRHLPEGTKLLRKKYEGLDGQVHTYADALSMRMDYVLHEMHANPDGFIESRRASPDDPPIQSMEDNPYSHNLEDGTPPPWDSGIGSIEVFGYQYDALLDAAELCGPDRAEAAGYYQYLAANLKQRIFSLWSRDRGYFARGTYRNKLGIAQPIWSKRAIIWFLLDSKLWDYTTPSMTEVLEDFVRSLFQPDMIAGAGFRGMSSKQEGYFPGEYQAAVWPYKVFRIAEGLRRQGFSHLAHWAYKRVVAVTDQLHKFPELVRGDLDGEIRESPYRLEIWREKFDGPWTVAEMGQDAQAWTTSAVAVSEMRLLEELPRPLSLEEKILSDIA